MSKMDLTKLTGLLKKWKVAQKGCFPDRPLEYLQMFSMPRSDVSSRVATLIDDAVNRGSYRLFYLTSVFPATLPSHC